jgi:hypothetical protein
MLAVLCAKVSKCSDDGKVVSFKNGFLFSFLTSVVRNYGYCLLLAYSLTVNCLRTKILE